MWCFPDKAGKEEVLMKRKLLTIILATTMALSFTACGGSSEPTNNDTKTETTTQTDQADSSETQDNDKTEETTYQSILDDYTQKLADATPGLVDEFNSESADKGGDINALAELCNAKVEKLAEICNDGVSEMASLMYANGDDYSTYEEWAGKLQDVYTTQAQQIQDAYTTAAVGQ